MKDVERAHGPDSQQTTDLQPANTGPPRFAGLERLRGALDTVNRQAAARSAALLHLLLAALLGAVGLLDPGDAEPGSLAIVALVALGLGMTVAGLSRSSRATPEVTFVADVAALALLAWAVAASGASAGALSVCYVLPVAHAAAVQSRGRLAVTALLAVIALFAPLLYKPASVPGYAVTAAIALVPAAVVVLLIHLFVAALREERRRAIYREAEAVRIAESDPLTGVGNYRMFRRALHKESARAQRHDQPFSLIVLDLDGFKAINDELGHQVGDDALRRVADALRGALRTEDVLCRQGGDEFGVIAVQAGQREAGDLGRRLRAAVGSIRVPGLIRPLSACAGWASFAHPVHDAEALMARADRELRAAKRRRHGEPPPYSDRLDPPAEAPSNRARTGGVDDRLATLSDCARSLALASGEREVGQLAVTQLIEALGAAVAELWRRDPVSRRPVLAARGRPTGPGRDRYTGGGIDPTLVERVMGTNRLLVVPVAPSPDPVGSTGPALTDVIVPVTRGGEVLGALRARLARPDAGSVRDRRLALALAAQVGVALSAAGIRVSLAAGRPEDAAREAGPAGEPPRGERVAELARAAGRRLGLDDKRLEDLRLAALLHRLGMVGVPAGLPLLPFALSEPEREVLQQHPVIAEELLVPIPALREAAALLRHAYERHDGRGYPDGLCGHDIPLGSRILHAAIAFVAMTSDRPYRPAMGPDEATAQLRQAARDGQLDPAVADVMLDALRSRPPTWLGGASPPAPAIA